MARTKRTAFTLVEMLVVIVIISMLVAMLVPAVIGARARARRVSCMSKMDQLGKGILQYETSKGHLPGYVNKIGGGTLGASSVLSSSDLSWVVVILENIGRADLWKEWRTRSGARPAPALAEVLCPSDLEKRGKSGALSYVVNCGISDERSVDAPAYKTALLPAKPYNESTWGLFFDHDTSNGLPGDRVVKIGLDEIADGAQQTIMLSENLDATLWADGTGPKLQTDVGIIWWSAVSGLPWTADIPAQVAVNVEFESPLPSRPTYRARPSSNHPGGVNAVFADGHAEFISDRVDYVVFRDQMISNQAKAKALAP